MLNPLAPQRASSQTSRPGPVQTPSTAGEDAAVNLKDLFSSVVPADGNYLNAYYNRGSSEVIFGSGGAFNEGCSDVAGWAVAHSILDNQLPAMSTEQEQRAERVSDLLVQALQGNKEATRELEALTQEWRIAR